MSLATTGGGLAGAGGAGGIAMAHSASGPASIARAPPPQAHATGGSTPPSASVLGSNLIDKDQGLSLKRVKNVSNLPIVALDIYGASQQQKQQPLAYFPAKPEDPSKGTLPIPISNSKKGSSFSTNLYFATGETAHKTLRKYLSRKTSIATLHADTLLQTGSKAATLLHPHLWLGYRTLEEVPESLRSTVVVNDDDDSAVISVANGTLHGQEDEPRVVFRIRLAANKKPLTVLPEEAMDLVIAAAQYKVGTQVLDQHSSTSEDGDDDAFADVPVALAMPAYASSDATIEALRAAAPGSTTIVQRNVALLAGALLPGDGDTLLQRLHQVRQALEKQHRKELASDPEAVLHDTCLVIVVSSTSHGVECTAIQVFAPNPNNVACLWGEFRVVSNVSYPTGTSLTTCAAELEQILESSTTEDGPTAIVLSGVTEKEWKSAISSDEWKPVPAFAAQPFAVAKGTAVLGGVAHGRLSRVVRGEGKPRAVLGIHVQTVAPMAVAIQYRYYDGENDDEWEEEPKVLFDFDRPTPAGPYTIDFEAAETVVYRERSRKKDTSSDSDEDFAKAVAQHQGHKGIPAREAAALALSIRILQQHVRGGEWKVVGEAWRPLTKQEDGKSVAIERVQLLITLSVTGLISTQHVGDG